MIGIISKHGITEERVAGILKTTGHGTGENVATARNAWAFIQAPSIYEDDSIIVAADSNIYNLYVLSDTSTESQESEAALLGMLYKKFSTDLFSRIRGPFVITVLDKKKKRLICATDRFGIKPVMYYTDDASLVFGGNIQEISRLCDPYRTGIDFEAVVDYMNLSAIPTPKTIFKSIRKLPPGHLLVAGEGQSPEVKEYCDIQYLTETKGENYFVQHVPVMIEKAVKRIVDHELSAGRKLGAFLSGGTDSSTLTGMIKKMCGDVRTFSIGFDEPGYNELEYARIAARTYGAEYHEYIVSPDDVLNALDIIIDSFDEPFGNASAIPTYYCARLAKENGVDSLFAGDGGDEIFGGNERYAASYVFDIYKKIPSILRSGFIQPLLNAAPSFLPFVSKGRKYIKRAQMPQPDRLFSYDPVNALGMDYIFSNDFLSGLNGYDNLQWARELYDKVEADHDLNRLLYIDMKFTVTDNDLRKVSTMSERAGVNVSYPFLDHDLVDFANTIPAEMKVKGTTLRYIFKKSLEGFLPGEIISKKKHGFGLPIGLWIRTKKNISSLVRETLLSSECSIRPYFRKGFIDDIFTLHRETQSTYYGDIIYRLLIFELWNRKKLPVLKNETCT